ncbi:MAG TPA: hypothetical protein VFX76_05415 [Roseiflexaceae bacterium]|nr:hypothetical protein [Roseiflexaceae bacterium]
MSVNRNRRLPADDIQANRNALIGIQSLDDYAPSTAAYSVARLIDLGRVMEEARQAEVRAIQALAMARDAAAEAEWALHDGILGAKAQVIAQYGPDSQAVQLVGLKRKSERKRPSSRTSATGSAVS